ncbi:hypothetical protein ACJ6WF_10225 [Streptomyces sp. MMS24-I2-30]|uniref:hypothetical protein n=1 Tax=Streptomyces sp. MMS24-I2-30 TaxID=3351564 RepID=UPI003896DFA7
MVDTMSLLRALLRSARRTRSAPRHGDGPPTGDEVLLDAPDERLAPALLAAGRGEYGPAAKLLATTREAAGWEDRDRYARRLAAFARSRPEWAEEWHANAPDDPDALLLRAQLAVDRCWASPARAELLAEVGPLVAAATRADPHDPVPWRIALDHACGTRAGHTEFERLWTEAVRRSPHHYGCHVAALGYLAATWHGSHDECFDFAESAAQDAPPGALVQALPAHAALSCLSRGAEVPRERVDAAADRAITLSARFPAADPWPAEVRNLLAYLLVCLDRRQDALDQLHLIGPYATSIPWDQASDDPLGLFLRLREELPAGTEQPTPDGLVPSPRRPRREDGGHAGARGH